MANEINFSGRASSRHLGGTQPSEEDELYYQKIVIEAAHKFREAFGKVALVTCIVVCPGDEIAHEAVRIGNEAILAYLKSQQEEMLRDIAAQLIAKDPEGRIVYEN